VITDRRKPEHVPLSTQEHHRIRGGPQQIADLLAMSKADDIELELARPRDCARAADLP
jgi:hypothetical protein